MREDLRKPRLCGEKGWRRRLWSRTCAGGLDQRWVGLVNVPITSTLNVDLLLVGPTGVWVLELGGVASEGESVQQELSAKDLADAEAKRLMRAADQLSALTLLLEEHCPTVDLAFRVAGGTVRYEKAPKAHGKGLDGPEHKGGWEMSRARILDGVRDDELGDEDCWQVLDVLARNAAELSEDFEQSSMVLAEEVYERKQAEINNILLLHARDFCGMSRKRLPALLVAHHGGTVAVAGASDDGGAGR